MPKHVLLIGSTGSLGPYLLDALLADPTVNKITCLNRRADALSWQKVKHTALGLIVEFQRVAFLKFDLSRSDLGLGQPDLNTIKGSATYIIHNAWTVNFNQHVSSFEPLLQGVWNVINFVYECLPRRVRLFFMSSVSIADRLRVEPQDHQVPEAELNDWRLAKLGYGQSKMVAESLIADAVARYGIDAAICRLCQLGGPVIKKGEWNRAEWIPGLLMSSKTMGILPESLGPADLVDWLPIDLVADICLELLFNETQPDSDLAPEHDGKQDTTNSNCSASKQNQVTVWHVINPNPTLWSHLVPTMLSCMKPVKPVNLGQWVDRLEWGENWQPDQVPSTKLIPLFRRLRDEALKHSATVPAPIFETKKTVSCSKTLARVPAVHAEWVELWMSQWTSSPSLSAWSMPESSQA